METGNSLGNLDLDALLSTTSVKELEIRMGALAESFLYLHERVACLEATVRELEKLNPGYDYYQQKKEVGDED